MLWTKAMEHLRTIRMDPCESSPSLEGRRYDWYYLERLDAWNLQHTYSSMLSPFEPRLRCRRTKQSMSSFSPRNSHLVKLPTCHHLQSFVSWILIRSCPCQLLSLNSYPQEFRLVKDVSNKFMTHKKVVYLIIYIYIWYFDRSVINVTRKELFIFLFFNQYIIKYLYQFSKDPGLYF